MEVLSLSPKPSDADIVTFLGVLSKDEESLRGDGGIGAILTKEGIASIAVVTRSLLSSLGEPTETVERDPGLQVALTDGANPEQFTRGLLEEAGGDGERLGTIFHDRYRDLSPVDESDVTGREALVTAFVDAFFFFDERAQVPVLGAFLTGQEDGVNRVFRINSLVTNWPF